MIPEYNFHDDTGHQVIKIGEGIYKAVKAYLDSDEYIIHKLSEHYPYNPIYSYEVCYLTNKASLLYNKDTYIYKTSPFKTTRSKVLEDNVLTHLITKRYKSTEPYTLHSEIYDELKKLGVEL